MLQRSMCRCEANNLWGSWAHLTEAESDMLNQETMTSLRTAPPVQIMQEVCAYCANDRDAFNVNINLSVCAFNLCASELVESATQAQAFGYNSVSSAASRHGKTKGKILPLLVWTFYSSTTLKTQNAYNACIHAKKYRPLYLEIHQFPLAMYRNGPIPLASAACGGEAGSPIHVWLKQNQTMPA